MTAVCRLLPSDIERGEKREILIDVISKLKIADETAIYFDQISEPSIIKHSFNILRLLAIIKESFVNYTQFTARVPSHDEQPVRLRPNFSSYPEILVIKNHGTTLFKFNDHDVRAV